MKKIILILALPLFLFISLVGATTTSTSSSGNSSNLVYLDEIKVSAILNNSGNVDITWSSYTQGGDFSYYKVVRSQTNNNPVYPDDGYIFYSTDLNKLSYTDEKVPQGVSYYRVCHIDSAKRYCSSNVIKIVRGSDTAIKEPVVCTMEYAPVCGSDGKTYSNKCMASASKAEVKYSGECKKEATCESDSTCNVAIGQSFIIKLKENPSTGYSWTFDYDKNLLRSDDKIATNSCENGMAGCGNDMTYQFTALASGSAKITFVYSRPWESKEPAEKKVYNISIAGSQACNDVLDQVCGVDGKTYGNECYAQKANIEVKYKGKCTGANSTATTDYSKMTREELLKVLIMLLQALIAKGQGL